MSTSTSHLLVDYGTLLTKSWSKLVKIGRHWSNFFFKFNRATQRYLNYIAHVCTTIFTRIHAVYKPDTRNWSKDVFGQGDLDDQYPKGALLVT